MRPGDPITVENGNFCVHGHVVSAPEGEEITVSLIGNVLTVPLSQVSAGHKPKVGKRMDWSELDRETTAQEDAENHKASMGEQFEEMRGERDGAMSKYIEMVQQYEALRAENEALAEIIAMQSDAIAELSTAPRTCTHDYALHHADRASVVAKTKETDEFAWFEKLVDLLELYLSRQLGTRRPISISDVDLRNLVQHILD